MSQGCGRAHYHDDSNYLQMTQTIRDPQQITSQKLRPNSQFYIGELRDEESHPHCCLRNFVHRRYYPPRLSFVLGHRNVRMKLFLRQRSIATGPGIGGYHRWDGNRYVWVPGVYEHPPHPHTGWVVRRGEGYVWTEGLTFTVD